MPGYPIRKPPDQSLVADSPRHIAGSHVLHRLLMPRHPPCALKNLNTQNNQKKLQNTKTPHTPPPRPEERKCEVTESSRLRDARVHCTVLKQQPAPPATTPETPERGTGKPGNPEDPNQHPHRENPAGVPTARFLRTQQRVQPSARPCTHRFPLPNPRRKPQGGAVLDGSRVRRPG